MYAQYKQNLWFNKLDPFTSLWQWGYEKKYTRDVFLAGKIYFTLPQILRIINERKRTYNNSFAARNRASSPVCFTICNCLEEIISFKTIYQIGICIRVEPRSRNPRHVPFWRDSLSVRFGYRIFLRHSPSRRTDLCITNSAMISTSN